MPVLKLLSPDARRVLRELRIVGAETTIGRSSDNAVVLSDDSVSRHHARLVITPEAYTILDEGSANGVWVRDARVRQAALSPDELFRVGDCLLQLVEDDARAVAAPMPSPAASSPAARPASAPRATSWGCWAVVLLFLVGGGGCGGGLLLYVLRDRWMPLFSGGPPSASRTGTPGPQETPAAQATPCPPPAAQLCPWTYKTAATTAAECAPGWCWDGGPLGTESCKQRVLVERSHRTGSADVVCDDGFRPILSRCSAAIERCVVDAEP
jgi:hypothetical protein